jgi:hypothetical protein
MPHGAVASALLEVIFGDSPKPAEGQRWRVARDWAGRRANERQQARYEDLLKALSNLAKRAVESRQPLIVL